MVAEAQFADAVHLLENDIVVHRYVPGGLIGHMDVMTLVGQADECTAHGNDVVVRMRGKDQYLLRERL